MATTGNTPSLAEALLMVQEEAPEIPPDGFDPTFCSKYGLMPPYLPDLNKHGILLLQRRSDIDESPALHTELVHVASGESIGDTTPLSPDLSNPRSWDLVNAYARDSALLSLLARVWSKVDEIGSSGKG